MLGRFLGLGTWYGLVAGFVSAEIFILGFVILDFVFTGEFSYIVMFILGQIYGTLPAVIVGATSGLAIGLFFFFIRNRLSPKTGAWLGLTTTGIVAFITLYLLFDLSKLEFYALVVFAPILILYTVSGIWGGYKLAGGEIGLSQLNHDSIKIIIGLIAVLAVGRALMALND
jgi:hypothetical protein